MSDGRESTPVARPSFSLDGDIFSVHSSSPTLTSAPSYGGPSLALTGSSSPTLPSAPSYGGSSSARTYSSSSTPSYGGYSSSPTLTSAPSYGGPSFAHRSSSTHPVASSDEGPSSPRTPSFTLPVVQQPQRQLQPTTGMHSTSIPEAQEKLHGTQPSLQPKPTDVLTFDALDDELRKSLNAALGTREPATALATAAVKPTKWIFGEEANAVCSCRSLPEFFWEGMCCCLNTNQRCYKHKEIEEPCFCYHSEKLTECARCMQCPCLPFCYIENCLNLCLRHDPCGWFQQLIQDSWGRKYFDNTCFPREPNANLAVVFRGAEQAPGLVYDEQPFCYRLWFDTTGRERRKAPRQPIGVKPTSVHGIKAVVDAVNRHNHSLPEASVARMQAIGSGHSFSSIDEGHPQRRVIVSLRGMKDVEQLAAKDGSLGTLTPKRGKSLSKALQEWQPAPRVCRGKHDLSHYLVRAGAGAKIAEVTAFLDSKKLSLPNSGQIDEQTISGAIATGTHGSGWDLPPLPDIVVAVEMCLPNGQLVRIEPDLGLFEQSSDDTFQVIRDSRLLRAASASAGVMGIITSVIMLVEDAFDLQERRDLLLWDRLPVQQLSNELLDNRHVELLINPYTEAQVVLSCCVAMCCCNFTNPSWFAWADTCCTGPRTPETCRSNCPALCGIGLKDCGTSHLALRIARNRVKHASHTSEQCAASSTPTQEIKACDRLSPGCWSGTSACFGCNSRRSSALIVSHQCNEIFFTPFFRCLPNACGPACIGCSLWSQTDAYFESKSHEVFKNGAPEDEHIISSEVAVPIFKDNQAEQVRALLNYVIDIYQKHLSSEQDKYNIASNYLLNVRFAAKSRCYLSSTYVPSEADPKVPNYSWDSVAGFVYVECVLQPRTHNLAFLRRMHKLLQDIELALSMHKFEVHGELRECWGQVHLGKAQGLPMESGQHTRHYSVDGPQVRARHFRDALDRSELTRMLNQRDYINPFATPFSNEWRLTGDRPVYDTAEPETHAQAQTDVV